MPDTPEIVKARTFNMEANPDSVAGQANETFKLTAKPGQALGSGGETVGFAKYKFQPELAEKLMDSDPGKYSTMNNVAGSSAYLFNDPNMSQPEQGNDRGLLTRSVASTAVDRYLGTNVVAEESFGVDANGTSIGISIQADGAGVTGKMNGQNAFLDVNYRDPDIQRGLSDLEVSDYVTGQIDRHGGNIFIDTSGPKPKVTGIDNDLAFPEMSRDKMQQNDKWVKELPRFIHQESADKILATDPEKFAEMLKNMPVPEGVSPLSDAAIEQAKQRLIEMQDGIRAGRPQVVQQFDDHTYQVCVQEQEARVKQHLDSKNKTGYSNEKQFVMADLKPEHSGTMLTCPRTSYVGTTLIQAKAYEIGIEEQTPRIQRMDELNALRPLTEAQSEEFATLERQQAQTAGGFSIRPGNTTKPANRDVEAAERNSLRADPSKVNNAKTREKIETAKTIIAASEKRIAEKRAEIANTDQKIAELEELKLNPPPPKKSFLQSAASAKKEQAAQMDSALNALNAQKKEQQLQLGLLEQKLEQRETQLDQAVSNAHTAQKHMNVLQQPLPEVPVVRRGRSNAVSEGSDNSVNAPVEETKNELSEDELAALDQGPLKKSSEIDSQEVGEETPKLKRSNSNRDLLASQSNSPRREGPAQENSNGAKWTPAKPAGGSSSLKTSL